ncbi:MAG: hypothetical protein IPO62_04275 [Saprospiraceae bacterium]|nr:hypothetical protein [Saprospiraceae bacterium]
MIKLTIPNKIQINRILEIYNSGEGNKINETLTKLFLIFNKKDKNEILIKAVSINSIYGTAIWNINPVVDKIYENFLNYRDVTIIDEYIDLVDKISEVSWIDKKGKLQNRSNLSFSSKYVHFLSNKVIPIYDSYVWILITGYLNQNSPNSIKGNKPNNYKEFYEYYKNFIYLFNLSEFGVYEIDKYLWQYCKILLTEISNEYNQDINKSKILLKKLI